ncbi:MAG: YDG domain-containing protein, partial [Actinomycetes bacterium]
MAGVLLVALILCLVASARAGAAKPFPPDQSQLAQPALRQVPPPAVSSPGAYAARPAGKGCSLGTPLARSPEGTTTPLRPTFAWSKVTGASYYDLEIYQGNRLKRHFDGHHATSRHVVRALPANVTLTWRVRARTARSAGAWSKGMKFVISPPLPVSPVATITSDTPTFQWGKLKGAAAYDCSVSGAGARLMKSGLTTLSYEFGQALPANVPLKWKVRGRNADGKGIWSRDVAFTVDPDAPTLAITASERSKTYGHALSLGDGAFTTAGLRPGDAVTSVMLSSAGATADARVGGSPYAIVPSAASGTGLGKYAITYVDGSLTVGRKPLTIGGAVAKDKFYDGTATATVDFTGADLSGVIGGDVVKLDSSGYSATFDSPSTGTGKPVTVTGATLRGADAGNYTVSQPSGLSADILPAITAVSSSTAPLHGRMSEASCFIPSGTATGDLVFAVIQAQDKWSAVPPLGPAVGDWTKIGDYSYTASISGRTHYFYQALYYLKVGATVPWHDVWDFFPAYLDNISVTNVTYRGASYDTGSNAPYTTDDSSLRAGSVTPATAGELLLFAGGAYDPSGIGTVSVSSAPTGVHHRRQRVVQRLPGVC